jgi:hypothetical protein
VTPKPPADPVEDVQSHPETEGSSIPSASPVVLVWLGDEGVYTNGVGNRDITAADGLSDEAIELALTNGTHKRA